MKKFILCASLILLFASCNEEFEKIENYFKLDTDLIQILSYELLDNQRVNIVLSENAELVEYEVSGVKTKYGKIGSKFSLSLPHPIEMGCVEFFSITARKDNGLITRATLRLVGKNTNLANAIINEISIKGTSTAPDRIELLVLSDGNMAGACVSDSLDLDRKKTYTFPSLTVKEGDIIVLYWDSETDEHSVARKNGNKTYYIECGISSTLISTDGIIALFSDCDGDVMDAIIYSNDPENEANPYGSDKLLEYAQELSNGSKWYGEPVDSSLVTSSRVLARIPGGKDSNSAEDWFTTKARMSSFGDENTLDVYSP